MAALLSAPLTHLLTGPFEGSFDFHNHPWRSLPQDQLAPAAEQLPQHVHCFGKSGS